MRPQSTLKPLIQIDKDKCTNCHQCIAVCPSKMCNDGSGDFININPDLCIGCGACIAACTHNARSGIDDFDAFMQGLKSNENIVAIVAPAVAANFPNAYLQFNGWLKKMGVKASFDVSFGAELTVKTYLEAIKSAGLKHVLAQPCPALVGYIELHRPELIPYLAPADSPMMHTMRMVREFYPQHRGAKFVIISPCYAKRREFDEVGIGDYNVTFKSLDAYFLKNSISLNQYDKTPYDNPEAERAVLFSTPGGLLRTAQREVPGVIASARKIEGRHTIYHYLDHFTESIKNRSAPLLVDCLNCEMGCNGGPGTLNVHKSIDEVEHLIEGRNKAAQQEYLKNSGILGKKRGIKKLHNYIDSHWKPGLYGRTYINRSSLLKDSVRTPSQKEIDEINQKMYKFKERDFLNCGACGYGNCESMAIAIFNGLNKAEHCRHYQELSIIKMTEDNSKKSNEYRKNIVTELQAILGESVNSLMSISGATEEMSATISEVAKNSETAKASSASMSTQATTVADIMQQLGNAAQEISAIVKTISDISSQTNLLALNATIEAASAGDAGKGFAVVASEVKELARKAASSSEGIKSKIQGIQQSVSAAIHNVNDMVTLMHEADQIVSNITNSIGEQSAATQEIARHISKTLAEVNSGIDRVAAIAES